MEGSSESGWQRSGGSRGLNSSFLDRNPIITRSNPVRFSGDSAAHDSARKGRGRSLWPHINNYRTQASATEDGGDADDVARPGKFNNNVSLRQWLDNPDRKVDLLECLHIFSQIVDIVNLAHSKGITVHNIKPSCIVMSSFNGVSFIESASRSDSSLDFQEYGSDKPDYVVASQMNSETSCLQSCSGQDNNVNTNKHHFPMNQISVMELNWYTAPEEVSGGDTCCASDIYHLGVLLFELFCTCGSLEEKSSTMTNLRHRVLPPQLLLKWPKEASFCLWLLHPDPSSRPKMDELLQSEFLKERKNDIKEIEAAIELREEIDEQDLLLEFLSTLHRKKQDAADSLNETLSYLSSDIEEATKLQRALHTKVGSNLELTKNLSSNPHFTDDSESCYSGGSRKRVLDMHKSDEGNQESALSKSSRLMKNFRKVESAYFSSRRRVVKPANWPLGRRPLPEKSSSVNEPSRWINTFLDGLCRYLAFSELKVKADLKQGDLLKSSNLICSLGFDRDGEFFATAGVNKKIKVFEYNSIVNEERDIHYPVVEMATRSKLSSICWNGYIKSQIASSNFEGVVQVWDVTRGEAYMEMREHERRVWSVDFSVPVPTLLASGSDDGSVKLWNINQGASVGTIRTKANVCSVQFPTDSGRTLAFGSADHRIYYYDLRNSKTPLCTLVGHSKTVSYVKFINSTTLVSASTDNTLKLWDLSMCSSRVLDCPLQSFTGHLNVKNFVGLSVSDGYIATGSETNEVFVYHKSFPMPALSFKFNSTDPFSGDEVDDSAQFISSVCWRNQSSTLVAANSMGNIKLLEMA